MKKAQLCADTDKVKATKNSIFNQSLLMAIFHPFSNIFQSLLSIDVALWSMINTGSGACIIELKLDVIYGFP
jgi:hypothetical protein